MRRASFLAGVLGLVGGLLLWHGEVPPTPVPKQVAKSYGRLPLSFEANRGQTDEQVKFLSRGKGYTLLLTPTEAVLALKRPKGQESSSSLSGRGALHPPETNPKLGAGHSEPNTVLRMKLVGANPRPEVSGLDELPGKSNYFIGNDPSKWRTNVPHYAKVHYQDIYPGIDLVYYGNQSQRSGDPASSAGRQLEYDFIVAPGADPDAIGLAFDGTDRLTLDAQGDLVLRIRDTQVRLRKPVVYQEVDGTRQEIAGSYVLTSNHQVTFEVAPYDASKPLIIDPVLVYSTYLGGSSDDFGSGVAVDAAGNAYVTGSTGSPNFPTANPFQSANAGDDDAFVTKFNAAGSALVYSTYLGGSNFDRGGADIAVDADGNAYVTGSTRSTDFPTANPIQPVNAGGEDAFVTKLNAAGSALVYSTYLGGLNDEGGFAIALDAAGNAYVTGRTCSDNFPTTAGAFQTNFPGGPCAFGADAFVTKFNADGSALVYSTYLGGSDGDQGFGITVDTAGNTYVTGRIRSTDFPTANPLQPVFGGGSFDAFITKLNADGSALVYSTYLGGSDWDGAGGIAVHAAGNTYVAGSTRSTNFPTTPGAFDTTCGTDGNCNFDGSSVFFDAFVTKLDAAGSALVYSTYLGGSGSDGAGSIAVDLAGNAYVGGGTDSSDFPTANPIQATFAGGLGDGFVTKLGAAGDTLVFSTYLGGSGSFREGPSGIAVDIAGSAYVVGSTNSDDFPTANPFHAARGGAFDAFVAKIDLGGVAPDNPVPILSSLSPASATAGGMDFTLTALGSDFVLASVVRWNGSDRSTTFVSSNELQAAIPASDLTAAGTLDVTVFNPSPGGGTSNSLAFTIADFTIGVAPASITVSRGQSASYTVTVSPQFGSFDASVSLSCSNLPSLSSCSFSPSSLTPGASDATSTLTVSTTAPASVGPGLRFGPPPRTPVGVLWLGVLVLALLGLMLARRAARRQLRFGLALGLLAWLLVVQVACGGGDGTPPSPPPPRPGTPTGTFNITITGTSGSLVRSTTATLVVQ